jgi:hypothetical protein
VTIPGIQEIQTSIKTLESEITDTKRLMSTAPTMFPITDMFLQLPALLRREFSKTDPGLNLKVIQIQVLNHLHLTMNIMELMELMKFLLQLPTQVEHPQPIIGLMERATGSSRTLHHSTPTMKITQALVTMRSASSMSRQKRTFAQRLHAGDYSSDKLLIFNRRPYLL